MAVKIVPSKIDGGMVAGDGHGTKLQIECVDADGNPFALGDVDSFTWVLAASNVPPAILTKTSGASQVRAIQQGESWFIQVDLEPEDTVDLAGVYYHECRATFSGDIILTAFNGNLTITKSLISAL